MTTGALRRSHWKWLLFVLLAVCSPACTMHVTVPASPLPRTEEMKIPLRVGLYLTEFMREGKNVIRPWRPESVTPAYWLEFSFGEALSRGAEEVLASVFEDVEVVPIEAWLAGPLSGDHDVGIVPEVLRIEAVSLEPHAAEYRASITVRWNVLDRDGELIYTNAFTGEATAPAVFFVGSAPKRFGECMGEAVADQFGQAREAIVSAGWWRSLLRP